MFLVLPSSVLIATHFPPSREYLGPHVPLAHHLGRSFHAQRQLHLQAKLADHVRAAQAALVHLFLGPEDAASLGTIIPFLRVKRWQRTT